MSKASLEQIKSLGISMQIESEWQIENEENSTIERLGNERRELNGKMMARVDYGVERETDGREEGRKGGRALEGLHIDRQEGKKKKKGQKGSIERGEYC